ncbi:MAG: hypothetical protein F4Y74_00510 [Gemmatimonadales bacterium]|nr:hypothetical protein [Gemmatimonadales bacterium]MYG19757.1 hypothetical protein [Gemmatimonadales bacterium]
MSGADGTESCSTATESPSAAAESATATESVTATESAAGGSGSATKDVSPPPARPRTFTTPVTETRYVPESSAAPSRTVMNLEGRTGSSSAMESEAAPAAESGLGPSTSAVSATAAESSTAAESAAATESASAAESAGNVTSSAEPMRLATISSVSLVAESRIARPGSSG